MELSTIDKIDESDVCIEILNNLGLDLVSISFGLVEIASFAFQHEL